MSATGVCHVAVEEVLKLWTHLGTLLKCRFPAPSPQILILGVWGGGSEVGILFGGRQFKDCSLKNIGPWFTGKMVLEGSDTETGI